MNGISSAELFFIISSVGFVILWVFLAVLIFYLIRATRTFEELLAKVKEDIDDIGDITKETLEDIRGSAVWNLIFRRKRKNRRDKSGTEEEK